MRLYASLVGDVPYDALNLAMVEADLPGGHAPGVRGRHQQSAADVAVHVAERSRQLRQLPRVLRRPRAGASVVRPGGGLEELSRAVAERGLRAVHRRALRARAARRAGVPRHPQAVPPLGHRPVRPTAPSISAIGSGTSRATAASSARWSTTRARSCCTCCAGWSATTRSSRACSGIYREHRFTKAGTADLQKAMELESGRDLARFFERWVFDSGVPRLRYATSVAADEATRAHRAGRATSYDVPVTVTIPTPTARSPKRWCA